MVGTFLLWLHPKTSGYGGCLGSVAPLRGRVVFRLRNTERNEALSDWKQTKSASKDESKSGSWSEPRVHLCVFGLKICFRFSGDTNCPAWTSLNFHSDFSSGDQQPHPGVPRLCLLKRSWVGAEEIREVFIPQLNIIPSQSKRLLASIENCSRKKKKNSNSRKQDVFSRIVRKRSIAQAKPWCWLTWCVSVY